MAENECKCSKTGIEITSNGTWTTGGYYSPNYSYTAGWNHAPKCQNCGYCSCCGKADIPGNLAGSPEPPDFIAK